MGDAAERSVDEFSLNHIANCVEIPRQLRTPPGRVLPPSVPRQLGRMMEDIQNRILLTTTEIVSAPDGQDRERLIKVSSSSHQHVTITEKKVT